MVTRSFTIGYSGAENFSKRIDKTGGAEIILSETITAGSTDLSIPTFKLDVSQAGAVFFLANQACVIETNSGGSPANTITLQANVPFLWLSGGDALRDTAGAAITTDITGLFITTASEVDFILEGRVVFDPTP